MKTKDKIKLVVYNNHTFGYILPEIPNEVQVLRDSILKGAPFAVHRDSFVINKGDKVRPVQRSDFDVYRICIDGYYEDDNYDFDRSL